MRNPQITTRLNQLMQEERALAQEAFTKAAMIKEIINYQMKLTTNTCPLALYEQIQDYSIGDLIGSFTMQLATYKVVFTVK